MISLISGLLFGFSLILAIGAQNAFILKQGLKKEFVFTLCFLCALSDAILIALGIIGFASITKKYAWLVPVATYAGALFLILYAGMSFYRAFTQKQALSADTQSTNTRYQQAILTCLAFTWLNPHVYLDTLVLMGMVSAQAENKLYFGMGAITASFVFFFSLGYGARMLSPIFAKPKAWQILDFIVGLIMLALAIKLLHIQPFYP